MSARTPSLMQEGQSLEVSLAASTSGKSKQGCCTPARCCIATCCLPPCLLLLLAFTSVMLCNFSMAWGLLGWLLPARPDLYGSEETGLALGMVRLRLPGASGMQGPGLLAQITYPAEKDAKTLAGVEVVDYIRVAVADRLSDLSGLPHCGNDALLGGQKQYDPPVEPMDATEGSGWPIIIFSSGLWGSAEMYTQLCRELASYGFIVVAIEHEDGSGAYATNATTGDVIEYKQDTENLNVAVFRKPFLEKRIAEMTETWQAVTETISSTAISSDQDTAAVQQILRKGDPDRAFLVGHSFGGAGVFNYLQYVGEHGLAMPFKGAVFYDLWGGCLRNATGGPTDWKLKEEVPYLLVTSNGFADAEWNFTGDYAEIIEANPASSLTPETIMVEGTIHQWVSDSHLFLPHGIQKSLGMAGPGDYSRYFPATIRLGYAGLEAMLDPAKTPKIDSTILAYGDVLVRL